MHKPTSPAILYWGTPVIIISTTNEDGTTNLAPMSSAWWLHQRCMLGLAANSQTTINLQRTKKCVLNLPSERMLNHINALAKTTGSQHLSPFKIAAGYTFVKDKFDVAGLTPLPSEMVDPSRVKECPVHMEAELVVANQMMGDVEGKGGYFLGLEVKVLRIHVEEGILQGNKPNRIDADKWRPMINCFSHLYGLGGRLGSSRLAEIDEEKYR